MNDDRSVDRRQRSDANRFGGKRVVNGLSAASGSAVRFTAFSAPTAAAKPLRSACCAACSRPTQAAAPVLALTCAPRAREIKKQVGYMTQRFSFYEDLIHPRKSRFVARMYAMANRASIVEQAMADLGLADRRNQLAGTLSGGWKQRLALAACMLHRPQAVVAGRAHRRGRSQGAARFLGRDSPAGGAGHQRAGVHPLHGRGRALPPPGLHRLRQTCSPPVRRTNCWRPARLVTLQRDKTATWRWANGCARPAGRANRSCAMGHTCTASAAQDGAMHRIRAWPGSSGLRLNRWKPGWNRCSSSSWKHVQERGAMKLPLSPGTAYGPSCSRNLSRCGATASPSP